MPAAWRVCIRVSRYVLFNKHKEFLNAVVQPPGQPEDMAWPQCQPDENHSYR